MDLLETAKRLALLVEEEARSRGLAVTLSVVDRHGNIVLKQRMTEAPLISIEMSERKAYTAVLLRMRTSEMTPLVQPGQPLFPLMSAAGGRFVALGGGIPFGENGVALAGMGVSGGTTEEDTAVADSAFNRLSANSDV